jgi:2-iminoacetate synthase ThiH
MVRVQIQLDPSSHRRVKRHARRLGVSVAEVVRRCIATGLGAGAGDAHDEHDEQVRRAMAVAGKYRDPDGAATIGRDHDETLVHAYRR